MQPVVIVDGSRARGGVMLIALGAFVMCWCGSCGASVTSSALPAGTAGILVLVLGVGGSVLPGVAIAVAGVRRIRLSRRLGTPTLALPGAEPLCLGGVLVARFCRQGGTARAPAAPLLFAELICQESATRQRRTYDSEKGWKTVDDTVKREVLRRTLAVTIDQIPDTVSGQITIDVPLHAPPSMRLNHNRITWLVQVRVRAEGVRDDNATFAVTVRPMVAARLLSDRGPVGRAPEPTP